MLYHKKLVRMIRSVKTRHAVKSIVIDETDLFAESVPTVHGIWQLLANKHEINKTISHTLDYSPQKANDRIDKALRLYTDKNDLKRPSQPPLHSLLFDKSTAVSGNLWHNGDRYYLAIKGTPEDIIAVSDLTENEREKAIIELHKLAAKGLKVIALAHCDSSYPLKNVQTTSNDSIEFDGLIAFVNSPNPDTKKFLQKALGLKIKVHIITADHTETALHIGKQLGIITDRDQVFDSRKMTVMNDEKLEGIFDNIRIFAHVSPKNKQRILNILAKNGTVMLTKDIADSI